MNHLLFILTIIIFVSCENSPIDKTKNSIHNYLRLTLHDYKSYEPLKYGELEIYCTDFRSLPEFIVDSANSKRCFKKYYLTKKSIDGASLKVYKRVMLPVAQRYLDSARIYVVRCRNLKDSFKTDTLGWKIKHLFRAKNLLGNNRVSAYTFYLNKNFTQVISAKEDFNN